MKPRKSVSYFPVSAVEQALLLRVREGDLVGRVDEVLVMLDQIAEEQLQPADLDQAIQLLASSKLGEGLDARFNNLEARLKERVERGLAEIEGRLSKRLAGEPANSGLLEPIGAGEAVSQPAPHPPSGAEDDDDDGVPREASVAFRLGEDLVWGASASQFYVAIWRWLFEHGHATVEDLPIQGGKKRYVVSTSAIHPSGKEFTRSEEPAPGVFVEVNLSRADIIRRTRKYLAHFGVDFEVVLGDD